MPIADMVREMKRHKSTIFCEIKHNFWADGAFPEKYAGHFGIAAHQFMQQRRSAERKLIRHPKLCQHVVNHLKNSWTPEQISNRLICDGVKHRTYQETICHQNGAYHLGDDG